MLRGVGGEGKERRVTQATVENLALAVQMRLPTSGPSCGPV